MSAVTVRNFARGEEETLLGILIGAFGGFQDIPQTKRVIASEHFNPDGCFIAKESHSLIGCVAVTNLPREKWFVIRYLAVNRPGSRTEVAEKLLGTALRYAKSKKPKFVRATTPAVQPYVDVYKQSGFRPVRRDFRISWNLTETHENHGVPLEMRRVTMETAKHAAELFVRTLAPYWNWRTTEQGRPEAVAQSFIEGMENEEQWMGGYVENKPVGLAGLIPDFYGVGEARFRGAFVVPELRGRGIGLALVREITELAREMGQRRMVVYTFSYLDFLAPGALLYLKSGGRIEAEYVQLQRE